MEWPAVRHTAPLQRVVAEAVTSLCSALPSLFQVSFFFYFYFYGNGPFSVFFARLTNTSKRISPGPADSERSLIIGMRRDVCQIGRSWASTSLASSFSLKAGARLTQQGSAPSSPLAPQPHPHDTTQKFPSLFVPSFPAEKRQVRPTHTPLRACQKSLIHLQGFPLGTLAGIPDPWWLPPSRPFRFFAYSCPSRISWVVLFPPTDRESRSAMPVRNAIIPGHGLSSAAALLARFFSSPGRCFRAT